MLDYTNCVRDAPYVPNPDSPPSGVAKGIIPYEDGVNYWHFKNTLEGNQKPVWTQHNETVGYCRGQVVANGSTAARECSRIQYVPDVPVCVIEFGLPEDLGAPVFLYYRLTKFYQNHRRYVKSLDPDQLKGDRRDGASLSSSCAPLATPTPGAKQEGLPYWPCGLIANSQFNDTFDSPVRLSSNSTDKTNYTMTNQGIAWSADAELYGSAEVYSSNYNEIVVPPNWVKRWPDGNYSTENPPPNLHTFEEFQVWMRTAGLPAFTKLALRNDDQTMPEGQYRIQIHMSESACI